LAADNSTLIIAADDDELVGYVHAQGGEYRRVRHCAYVVVGVLPSHQGRGLGTALLAALERWAVSEGLKRLELTVRVDNDRARRLYERAGYRVEGIRRASLQVGAELIDEVAMARVFP
jgi:RimJ/RimL family protein N-acetyltransferase